MLFVEQLPGGTDLYPWFRHASWNGWTGADLVFPAFLFLVGSSLWFFCRRTSPAAALPRVLRRTVGLFVLGLVFNAWGSTGLDLGTLRIPGVLQRIAVTYLLAWLVVVVVRRWWAVLAVAVVVLAGYHAVLTRWSPECHARRPPAERCTIGGELDRRVFGDAHLYQRGAAGYDPEGILSTAGATATVLFGWVAGAILGSAPSSRRAGLLLLTAAAAAVVTSALSWQSTPINKRLWTPPFALATAGATLVVLAVLSFVADANGQGRAARGGRAVALPLAVLGRNALLVYLGQHVIGAVAADIEVGTRGRPLPAWVQHDLLEPSLSEPHAALVWALLVLAVWWGVAVVLHRWHVYVSV